MFLQRKLIKTWIALEALGQQEQVCEKSEDVRGG
jgi:hypothetical protein